MSGDIRVTRVELTALRKYMEQGKARPASGAQRRGTQTPMAKVKELFAKVKKGVQNIGKPSSLHSRIAKYNYKTVKGTREAVAMVTKAYNDAHAMSGGIRKRKDSPKAKAFFKDFVRLPQFIKIAVQRK